MYVQCIYYQRCALSKDKYADHFAKDSNYQTLFTKDTKDIAIVDRKKFETS